MTEYVSLTRLRDAARVSSATARRALDAAGITANDQGKFPLDLGLAAIDAQRSPDKALGKAAAAHVPTATTTPASGAGKPVSDLATARARSEIARAIRLEIENRKSEGDLLSRETVRDAGRHYSGHIRAGLMSFGASVAADLVGISADQISAKINEAMRATLTRLGDADEFVIARVME